MTPARLWNMLDDLLDDMKVQAMATLIVGKDFDES